MSAKRAKLNLDFGHSGVRMNFAMANDFQPRYGEESDWNVGTLSFNSEEFEDFPGISQNKINGTRIKAIAGSINRIISEWQKETGYDFDSHIEITVSATFFDVLFFPYNIEFSEIRNITEDDIRKIEKCKLSMYQIPIPDEKIKSFTSPYFIISNEMKILEPIGRKTKSLGFNAYFITKHPMLSKLLEVMKEDEESINVSLSCEKEFKALANKEEKKGKTALIHITDSMSEFSMWENSELKYLNKKDTGFTKLKEAIWRLCLCYHKKPELTERDFELVQRNEYMQKFYNKIKNSAISENSREFLSADDCSDLFELASCILENETENSVKYSRFELPGRDKSRTKLTVSNYVLSYFTRESVRNLLFEIMQIMYNDDFCRPESIILDCSLPLKGIEELAEEVFGVPARRSCVKWAGETRLDFSSAGIGALQSLISGEERKNNAESRKKTTKLFSIIGSIFSRA